MKYYTQARLFPTILTSMPLLILAYIIIHPFGEKLAEVTLFLPTATVAIFYAAFTFLSVQLNRIISKEVFQEMFFKDELYMPTTTQLLWSNSHYDDVIKDKIHTKIRVLYQLTLASRTEEQDNEVAARKSIAIAVSQIRNTLRENKMLLQHNIEYGFFRNLLGGCLVAIVMSIGVLIYAYSFGFPTLLTISIIMLVVYSLPILFSKQIINKLGKYYTKILIEQFLSHQ